MRTSQTAPDQRGGTRSRWSCCGASLLPPNVTTILYEFITLTKQGEKYIGKIPAEAIHKEYDFMYYLEAVDETGTGCYAPDWEHDIAYYLVNVKR